MKINVTRSSLPPFDEYCEEIRPLWESRWLTNNGAIHKKFEEELKKYLNCKYVSLFVNGHLALENAFEIYKFPKGSEVITTPFTFVSTTNSIVRNGLIPVFCDINSNDLTINVDKIEELITKKTVAILAVHVYGNVCDVEKIEEIAKKHNLVVIYDAAHAFGVKYREKEIGAYGDVSMFSFHATKVFNSIEGGCLVYNDEKFYKNFDSLKNFGLSAPEECVWIGGNAKMNEFQAAMGVCNLRHINEYIEKRKIVFQHYVERLKNIKGIILPTARDDVLSNYAYFPIVFSNYKYNRDKVLELLEKHDIHARRYFYPLTSEFECYKNYFSGHTPVAKFISERILTLPIYPDLSIKDVDKICDIIIG